MFDFSVSAHTDLLARATLRNHSGKKQNNSMFGNLQCWHAGIEQRTET
jgi:hypothetical protein